ncbi:aldo/keto reductase [Propionibacteriaceae bacterium Y2011]
MTNLGGPIPTVQLRHGAEMPVLGLGTAPMDDAETAAAVRQAVEFGYRHFDTAEQYCNERGVGLGIRDSGLDRSEVFVTTKFNRQWHSVDGARQAWRASIERLGTDYVDLLLIHWPHPAQDRYVDAFRGLVELLQDGSVRAIGTSNFKPAHIARIVEETGEVPDVNQIELSPYTTRDASRADSAARGIVTESYSPIKRGGLLTDPVVFEVAEAIGRTPAQTVLRWHVQQGLVPIPKSANPQRMQENATIFDFELTDEQLGRISALDRGEAAATDSDTVGH